MECATRSASAGSQTQAPGQRSVASTASAGAGSGGTSLNSLEARRSGGAALVTESESTIREHWAYEYDPFGRRIAKYPISQAAARAWIEHGDEAALAKAMKDALRRVRLGAPSPPTNTPRPGQGTAHVASQEAVRPAGPSRLALPNPAHPTPAARSTAAPTLFCWDGNRLLAEQKGDTHQLYLYEPDSFVPLAIVRWKAANADTADASGTDAGTRAAKGSKLSSRAATPSTATDTDRSPLLPPELLSLKDRYPEQWAKLEAQRRKLARQFGQSPEHEAPTPPKPEVFHVHVDHLGTPREITDTDGHLVWTANYAAWGKAITANPPRRILTRQGSTVAEVIEEQAEPLECNLRFQGQYADAESGLHYNRFRYFEPEVGRFSSQDPIRLSGGSNLYQYASNPTEWIDPLGLRCARQFHSFQDVKLPSDKLYASDAVQFRIANREFLQRMNNDARFRRDMLGRHPQLAEWMRDPNLSGSPAGLTWHHDDEIGMLKLVDRGDHAGNHGIYHPTGQGGREQWGGGEAGRRGKLDPKTGCPR